jgi:CelD/BcsL family acetyltransferase involved in cellulose biosynthesis
MNPEAEILDSEAELEPYVAEWDRLAVASGRPFAAPAWALAWWRHAAPEDALLRVVVVRAGEQLAGVAPYFAQRGGLGRVDYRLLGSGDFHRIGPLALAGSEPAVAAAVMRALAGATPRPAVVTLEGVAASAPWAELFVSGAPGHIPPRRYQSSSHSAPVVSLSGRGYGEWLATKSANFRQQMKRARRRADLRGATFRLSTRQTLETDLSSFARLHRARRSGADGWLSESLEAMLVEAAERLVDAERFRLWLLEANGEAVAAQIFAAAGGEVAYWNGGFDSAWADVKPGMLAILAAIEDACRRGEIRVDLGGGAYPYKLRFADSDDPIAWGGVMPRTAQYPLVRGRFLPREVSWLARRTLRRLPPGARQRLKRLLLQSRLLSGK